MTDIDAIEEQAQEWGDAHITALDATVRRLGRERDETVARAERAEADNAELLRVLKIAGLGRLRTGLIARTIAADHPGAALLEAHNRYAGGLDGNGYRIEVAREKGHWTHRAYIGSECVAVGCATDPGHNMVLAMMVIISELRDRL